MISYTILNSVKNKWDILWKWKRIQIEIIKLKAKDIKMQMEKKAVLVCGETTKFSIMNLPFLLYILTETKAV